MSTQNEHFIPDYQLIDSGDFEKLERFGEYYLIRPESQAIWKKRMTEKQWNEIAHAQYRRESQKSSYRSGDMGNGNWTFLKRMPENWQVSVSLPNGQFKLKLALTSFGHVGIFPEQAENWRFIYESIHQLEIKQPKVLNAFAYTGGASLAACAAGAQVTHVDAVKQIVAWGKENMQISNLNDIRWIVDDAVKFLKREVKRGVIYDGIILDPPAYGRGPDGERWILDEGINTVLELSQQLLNPNRNFFVLNLYSLGYSPIIADNLVESYFKTKNKWFGESFIHAKSGLNLPLGTYVRFRN
jgi:23S rRNA (cytosine1962-C5)-methyltransferase